MKRRVALAGTTLAFLGGCAAGEFDAATSNGGGAPPPSGARAEGGEGGEGEARSTVGQDGQVGGQPGQLTAGDFDDNLNFDFFQRYRARRRGQRPSSADFSSTDRVVIHVRDAAGRPASGARVAVLAGGRELFSAPAGADGRVLFFPSEDGAAPGEPVTVRAEGAAGTVEIAAPAGREWEVVVGGEAEPPAALDLAFVIDATGSMGDELEYVKAEIESIAATVRRTLGQGSMRFALIVYRDVRDEYVTRVFDFTDSLSSFQDDLGRQFAGGGGDYPEAMELALHEMNQLGWRSGNVARVVFLIADAPPHSSDEADFIAAARSARRAGVRLYPLAASGVAEEAEFLMRVAAQMTLGRYLFLTDDSGIGNDHAEPEIPCYQVQRLDRLMIRMIETELTGRRIGANPDEVIRTVGSPVGDRCVLRDGTQLQF